MVLTGLKIIELPNNSHLETVRKSWGANKSEIAQVERELDRIAVFGTNCQSGRTKTPRINLVVEQSK